MVSNYNYTNRSSDIASVVNYPSGAAVKEENEQTKEADVNACTKWLECLTKYNKSERMMIFSFVVMLGSFILPIKVRSIAYLNYTHYISFEGAILFCVFYIYPVVVVVRKGKLNTKIALSMALAILLITVLNLYDKNRVISLHSDDLGVASVGMGPVLSFGSAVLFLFGVISMHKHIKLSKQS